MKGAAGSEGVVAQPTLDERGGRIRGCCCTADSRPGEEPSSQDQRALLYSRLLMKRAARIWGRR